MVILVAALLLTRIYFYSLQNTPHYCVGLALSCQTTRSTRIFEVTANIIKLLKYKLTAYKCVCVRALKYMSSDVDVDCGPLTLTTHAHTLVHSRHLAIDFEGANNADKDTKRA
jgi:hypothetical protein